MEYLMYGIMVIGAVVLTFAAIGVAMFNRKLPEFFFGSVILGALVATEFVDFVPGVFTSVYNNWVLMIYIVIGYFVIGAVYAMLKWYRTLVLVARTWKNAYSEEKAYEINKDPNKQLSESVLERLKQNADNIAIRKAFPDYQGSRLRPAPLAYEHKMVILHWMTFWPFSMLMMLLEDMFVNIWNFLYRNVWRKIFNMISGMFQVLSNRAFRDIDK